MDSISKVWVIIYRLDDSRPELLLLRPTPEPDLSYDYYVITGGIESGETPDSAAYRETYEEIGIKPTKIIDLEETMTYVDERNGNTVTEKCFLIEISHAKPILNEEHIDYRWVSLEEFEKLIWWEGSRIILNRVIKKSRTFINADD